MGLVMFLARRIAPGRSNSDESRGRMRRSPALGVGVAAVALSTAVMIASICICAGFKQQITHRITGFNSHLTLVRMATSDDATEGPAALLSPSLAAVLDEQPYITDRELELSVPAVLKTDTDFKGVYVRGVSGNVLGEFLSQHLLSGHLPSDTTDVDEILVSKVASDALGLKLGGKVPVYFMGEEIRVRPMTVSGIFDTHFEGYDDLIAIVPMGMLQTVAGFRPAEGTCIRIQTDDFNNSEQYRTLLQDRLNRAYSSGEIPAPYLVETAVGQGAAFFSWLDLLDTNVAIILGLMTVVACITLIGGMLILIIDKVRLIGVLRAMGANGAAIRKVFIMLALRIALRGLLIGDALMITVLWLQQRYHFLPLDADNYYIDFVPVQLEWIAVGLLNVGVFMAVLLTLLLPARMASRITPARAMRYSE